MGKNKLKEKMDGALHEIDAAMIAINAFPSLEDALLSKSQDLLNKYLGKLFPTQLDFAKEILEHLVGTDVFIKIVSTFLTTALPEVEIALKAALLANMANLGSQCEIDPIIWKKAIKEGIIFDLKQIDLIDKLSVSPLDKKLGQYYYFGIEGCESAYDILQSAIKVDTTSSDSTVKTSYMKSAFTNSVSHYFNKSKKRDFDCLLWYMKNKAAYREVWGKRTNMGEDIFMGAEKGNDAKVKDYLSKKGKKKTTYFQVINENDKDGIYKWSYNKEWKKTKTSGVAEKVDKDTKYVFNEGGKFYSWIYGYPSIKKVSRKKYYLTDKEQNQLYYWDATAKAWTNITVSTDKYNSIDEIPKDKEKIKSGTTFYIGDALKIVTSTEHELKEKTETDKYGKTTTAQYWKGLKLTEPIDISNDIANKVCLFIDYEQDDNKKKIEKKDYEKLTISFGVTYDNVNKTWTKVKADDGTTSESINTNNLYYEDVDTHDGGYNEALDKILIYPHEFKGNVDGDGKQIGGKSTNFVVLNTEGEIKYTRDMGVITLEYSPRTGNLKQSDGNPMLQQTPYDNVLHVFFGNVKEIPSQEKTDIENSLKSASDTNKKAFQVFTMFKGVLSGHLSLWKQYVKDIQRQNKIAGKKGEAQTDIQSDTENKNYKNAYDYLKLFLYGNGETFRSRLTSKLDCFNDISQLNVCLTKIEDHVKKYYKEETVKNGFGQETKTGNWIPKDETFSYEEFARTGGFVNTISDCLMFNKEMYSVYAFVSRASQLMEANENLLYLSAKNQSYPDASQNFYLYRTLMGFNFDYVNSLQLFDEKVLAAQIITSLFGGVTLTATMGLGATAAWKTELIRDTVKNMVEKTIAAQDYTVSDCFFTFTNDAYNGMLRAAELRQAGLYSKHGEENGNNTINPMDLLSNLNGIDNAADKVEQATIIEGALEKVSVEVSKDTYSENGSLSAGVNANFGMQTSFIEELVKNLCTQIVMAMLSPKVYLLILINLHMFGLTTNFDIKSFIENFTNFIMTIIKSVVEKFMEHLTNAIMEFVEDLVSKLAQKLVLEQVEMYMRLLKQIWEHFKQLMKCQGGLGWTQDIAGTADITDTDTTEVTDEC